MNKASDCFCHKKMQSDALFNFAFESRHRQNIFCFLVLFG